MKFLGAVTQAGGKPEVIDLPKMGIRAIRT